ncbi:MAG: cytochrome c [Anaerolineales bacterium]|nr:c-type cytochrome [Anaerolineales bacterium]MDW8447701.1 cytochrome c [Anaerolineales bacterium]
MRQLCQRLQRFLPRLCFAQAFPCLGTLLLAIVLSGCSFSLAADVTPPPGASDIVISRTQIASSLEDIYPLVPPDVLKGKAIYEEKCAPCHGINGDGDGPRAAQLPNSVPALSDLEVSRQAVPAQWYLIVTNGNLDRFMPPFPSLSDSQRWDVVAYALSLSTSSASIEQGAKLYQEYCAACHGVEGKGDGPQANSLAKPPTNLTDFAFSASRSAFDLYSSIVLGLPPSMPAFADQLSEEERWAIVAYLQSLTFTAAPEELQNAAMQATLPVPSPGEATVTATPAPITTPTPLPQGETRIGKGMIKGRVSNGSGGQVPPDLVVTLEGYDDFEPVLTVTTTLKSDNSFLFEQVEMREGRVFLVYTEYGGTTYTSDVAVAPAQDASLDLPLVIYDTTTDPSVIKCDRLHLFLDLIDESTLRIAQLYIMSNTSNKTLIAERPGQPTVRFKLPVGSSNLEFQDGALGERYIQTPDGFGDTASIRPGAGNYQVLFAFTMPYNRKLELVQPVSMPIDALIVLVPEGNLKVRSPLLRDEGKRNAEGTTYHVYSGGSLAVGEELRLSISGQPGAGSFSLSSGSRASLMIGLSVFGLALILAGIWFYRNTRVEELDEEPTETGENLEVLLDAILALDDQYQSGELPEEAYLERRAELRAKIKELKEKS